MTSLRRIRRTGLPHLLAVVLLASPLLTGCSDFSVSQTDFAAYTIDAADGESYKDFQYQSFSVCPQGFRRIDATASNDGEGTFTQWKIRCLPMVIHAGE